MVDLVDRDTHFECVIRSESEAWQLLKRIASDDFEDKIVLPEFKGWPDLKIKYWRRGENRLLTAPMMEGLLDVQEALYRAFLLVEEDTSNLRRLSEYQREKYEIGFTINSGSTEAKPDWPEIAKEFVQTVASKMNGKQATIIILVALLAYAGNTAWSDYLDHKAEQAELNASNSKDEQIGQLFEAFKLSEQADLERMKLLRDMAASNDHGQAVLEASEDAKDGILKSAKRVDSTEVAGMEIPPEAARRMSRAPKAENKAESVKGTFVILRNDTTLEEGFRVRLRNTETGEEFFASLRDRLVAPNDREIIAKAEWEKVPIRATIAVTRRRGAIVKAQILAAEELKGG